MTRIAHLSDLHLIEAEHQRRDTAKRIRLSYLSFGRKLDAEDRRQRLRSALWAYKGSGAEHLVITGDLTEDGNDEQFEVFASILDESAIDPREVTLTAGNHDAYHDRGAFHRALQGPLAAFAETSRAGAVTALDDVVIVPISTVIAQPFTRSAGEISRDHLGWVDEVTSSLRGEERAIAVAQHHQPYGLALPGRNWIDGLQNHASAMGLLRKHAELHVLHGHMHAKSDRAIVTDGPTRVFGTTACVDHEAPLRIYEACEGRLFPVETATTVQVGAKSARRRSLETAPA